MPDFKLCDDGSSAEQDKSPSDTIAARRKRLAQMIGRLLARTWLSQRRAAETKSQTRGGPQEHGCS